MERYFAGEFWICSAVTRRMVKKRSSIARGPSRNEGLCRTRTLSYSGGNQRPFVDDALRIARSALSVVGKTGMPRPWNRRRMLRYMLSISRSWTRLARFSMTSTTSLPVAPLSRSTTSNTCSRYASMEGKGRPSISINSGSTTPRGWRCMIRSQIHRAFHLAEATSY